MSYAYTRLRAEERDFRKVLEALAVDRDAVLGPARRWGVFAGLFGIASNELIVVSAGDPVGISGVGDRLRSLPGAAAADTLLLEPTSRPVSPEPLARPGLYVFRFFEIAQRDSDEIVRLSTEAWESFEQSDAYAAEPQGLFRPLDRSAERGRMLLVTWYDGLASWQASRQPDPRARANFVRRHELTGGTVAYATRLIAGP